MKWRYVGVWLLAATALLGMSRAQAQTRPALSPAWIDHLIRLEWHKQNIQPAPPVDDARFLRRAYLDILGTIPPPDVVTAFLADKSPNKRAKLIDTLLDDPRYANHWTDYWDNTLMGQKIGGQLVDRSAFREWLRQQFLQNTPWNKFVYNLISASGQNSTGGTYAKARGLMMPAETMQGAMQAQAGTGTTDSAPVNGAVNWTLKYAGNPQDLSGTVSKIFLGVQIQCAQCHDEKMDKKWKQEDFRRFTACFINTRPLQIDRGKVMGIRRVDVIDIQRPFLGGRKVAANNQQYAASPPVALDGTDFSDSPNRRQALAAWMTAPQNPWFAQAIVNRMWNHFLGRGFVERIDDFRASNPPVMPNLLKALADDFTASGYDLKHLIRLICATQVYQLSAAPAHNAEDPGNTLWERYRLKALSPEELLDSLVDATNLEPVLERVAGDRLERLKFAMRQQFTFLFDVDEEFEQKEFSGTIPQVLMLLNGNLVNRGVTPIPGTALSDILAAPGGDAGKIEALYLRTLSRKPTPAEIHRWVAFVNGRTEVAVTQESSPPAPTAPRRMLLARLPQGKKANRPNNGPDPLARFGRPGTLPEPTPRLQAYEDLFWALLNSSEFTFNH
ncbi:MAG TPA: DUF1549 and DUF1553 domain-containing protein [Chthonomonadaceae bacterium]|nr:DUF1549 and DUF1553 domain-containing protein [Chthonomonadaceae bacterium]